MESDSPQGSVTQEYAPIGGEADFCRESAKLAFGDTSPVVTNGLNVTVQVTAGSRPPGTRYSTRRLDPELSVFRIRDILVRIRMLIRILDPYLWLKINL
jgi:hypothetical protein